MDYILIMLRDRIFTLPMTGAERRECRGLLHRLITIEAGRQARERVTEWSSPRKTFVIPGREMRDERK